MKRPAISLAAFLLTIGCPLVAYGQLFQPDGTRIPVIESGDNDCNSNTQICLDQHEGVVGAVSSLNDGRTIPETFNPLCNLTFKVLARGAKYKNIFGWYNVAKDPEDPSKYLRPPVSEHYPFLVASDGVGTVRTLELANNKYYKGGEIGFFIATGNSPSSNPEGGVSNYSDLFYSQQVFNNDNSIHVIIWQSVHHGTGFYFGWEDLRSGGDNDFTDIFTFVDGIQCTGGGAPCDTGLLGVCADGVMMCQKSELGCVQLQREGVEKCNALDDDCNGLIDDGDLCAAGFICDKGTCVPKCGTGEFRCQEGVCASSGLCVDPACEHVVCPSGEVCRAGECVDACSGVTCPYGQRCRGGVCLERCAGVECDAEFSCNPVTGICESCACTGCADGQTCRDNICVEAACGAIDCVAGTHCAAGACVDDCDGAVCPGGAVCAEGICGAPQSPDSPQDDPDSGAPIIIDDTDAGSLTPSNPPATGGTGSGLGSRTEDVGEAHCACSLPAPGRGWTISWLIGLGILGLRRGIARRAKPRV